jgi:hypothetical protein
MPSIRIEFSLDVPVDRVWPSFRAVDQVHKDLAPGFVKDCVMDGDARLVTFANGFVARELIVDVDDAACRLAYSARSPRLQHHHASFQVLENGSGSSRIVWIADVLPAEAASAVRSMMEEGVAAMRRRLEGHGTARAE